MKCKYSIEIELNSSKDAINITPNYGEITKRFVDIVDRIDFRVFDGVLGKIINADYINITESQNGHLICETVINQNGMDIDHIANADEDIAFIILDKLKDLNKESRIINGVISQKELLDIIKSKTIPNVKTLRKGLIKLEEYRYLKIIKENNNKVGRPSVKIELKQLFYKEAI